MYIVNRALTFARGALLSYGSSGIKRRIWDKEFSGSKWDFIDDTTGDCVYPFLEKYAHDGNILDLGCGPGNTANELAADVYRSYIGVDISEAALVKARERSQNNGRTGKNSFVNSDFLSYQPTQAFDIILFRESLYHVPYGQVLPVLHKFSKHLNSSGVFIVRLYAGDHRPGVVKRRVATKLDLIKGKFNVVEACQFNSAGLPNVVVFRP
jgi:SAM-dependent methyltransferase